MNDSESVLRLAELSLLYEVANSAGAPPASQTCAGSAWNDSHMDVATNKPRRRTMTAAA